MWMDMSPNLTEGCARALMVMRLTDRGHHSRERPQQHAPPHWTVSAATPVSFGPLTAIGPTLLLVDQEITWLTNSSIPS